MSLTATIVLGGVLLLLAAVPTGVAIWSLPLAAGVLATSHCLMALFRARAASDPTATRLPRTAAFVYLAVLGFFILVLVPLPLAASRLTGSARFAQNSLVADALHEAEELELMRSPAPTFATTRNRMRMVPALFRVVAMFSAAGIASHQGPTGRRLYLVFLLILGALIGVAGTLSLRRFPQGDTLWWRFAVPWAPPGPVACFVNRNHFAAFLAMLCPASLALLADSVTRRRLLPAIIALLSFAALAAGVACTMSRGGALALCAAMAATAGLFMLQGKWGLAAVLGSLVLAAAVGAFAVAGPEFSERMATLRDIRNTDSYQTRTAAWRDSVSIWAAYPILGAGPNAFRTVYPQHRTTTQGAFMKHPENQYVQVLAETGLIGVGLVLAACFVIGRHAAVPALRLSRGGGTATVVAALGGAATAAVTACYDFALHMPLYAVALASLVGLLFPSRSRSRAPSQERAAALCGLVLCAILMVYCGGRVTGDIDMGGEPGSMSKRARALVDAPTSWRAWFHFGRQASLARTRPASLLAERCLSQAGAYDRNNYRLWEQIGRHRLALGLNDRARDAFDRVRELRDWVWIPPIPEE
ncbi:O-antigen ligase family protein [Verrucomicrobiota bacterium]